MVERKVKKLFRKKMKSRTDKLYAFEKKLFRIQDKNIVMLAQ